VYTFIDFTVEVESNHRSPAAGLEGAVADTVGFVAAMSAASPV
jgi:hypothetical protein